MNRQPVQSSNLASIGYDSDQMVLEVEFKSGKVYQYHGIPFYVYSDLMSGGFGSVGRYFNVAVAKAGYKFEEVKEEERKCNVCGETWVDTGNEECPFCGSENTEIDDSEDASDDPDPIAA